ncbi:MAG: hypothetical protein ACREJC_03535, partial [Tepidisphaeraceae bacterium]
TVFWALAALNVVLLISLVSRVSHPNAALAQAPKRPGDYMMIPGQANGVSAGVVYVLDTTNGLLTGLTFDENARRIVNIPKVDLQALFTKAADALRAQPPRRGNR